MDKNDLKKITEIRSAILNLNLKYFYGDGKIEEKHLSSGDVYEINRILNSIGLNLDDIIKKNK